MTDQSPRSTCAHWSRAGPVPDQSQEPTAQQRKAIGCCRWGGVGAKGDAAFSFALSIGALAVADLLLGGLCLVVSRGSGFGCLGYGWKATESPQGPLSHKFGRQSVGCASQAGGRSVILHTGGKKTAFKNDLLGPKLKLC